ncbi:unnamed protein product [Closterium sp. NIES-64]|nr:unnamed protein product [Closterium sp. NIES-64]
MNRDDDVSEPFLKLERTDKDGTQHVRKIANTIDACDGCEDEGPSVSPGICVKKEPADWRCTGGRAVGAAVGGSGGQAAAPAIDNGVDVRATRGGASGAAGGRNADHVAGVAANAARRQKGSGRAKPEHAVASSAPQDTVEQTRGGDAGRINTQKLLANTEQGLLTVLQNHGKRIRNLEVTNQAMKSMVIACIESVAKTLSGLGEDLKSQHPRPPPYPTAPHPGSQGNENVGLCRQAGKDVRNEGKPAGLVSAPTPPKCPPADGELPQASASLKRGRFDRECMPPLALAQQLILERSTCGGAQQDVCGTEGPGAEAGAGAGGRAGGDTEKKGVSDEGTPRAVEKGGLCTVGEEHARNEVETQAGGAQQDVCETEGPGAEAGAGAGGRAGGDTEKKGVSDEGTPRAVEKGGLCTVGEEHARNKVETQAGGRRADDAGMASAGGAEERAVCAGEEAKEVKSTDAKGILPLMARTVFGEQVDIGGLGITSSKASWEADRNKARLISPGLWAVMYGHGLASIMAGYRAVLEGFTADEGDEESAQLAICAAIGTAAANFEKRSGATAKVFAPALAASCAAVWSIWRGVRTNCAVDRAVAAAKAVGAEQSQLAHCKDVITAVLNTLGNRSHERREEAKSDPDGHVAWVIEQALGGPGLATSDDAKVVAKERDDRHAWHVVGLHRRCRSFGGDRLRYAPNCRDETQVRDPGRVLARRTPPDSAARISPECSTHAPQNPAGISPECSANAPQNPAGISRVLNTCASEPDS